MKGQSVYVEESLFFGSDPYFWHFFPKELGKTVNLLSYQANFETYHFEIVFS